MTEWKYLPILKWKQGERIALRNLKGDQWDGVIPLIELLPISAAPNFSGLQAALPEYVEKIGKDLAKTLPEGMPFAIDTRYVSTGYPKQAQLLSAVCFRLGKLTERPVLPVIPSALVQSEVNQLERIAERFDECILRIDTPSVGIAQVQPIAELVKDAFHMGDVHVVIDQFSLVGKDPKVMASAIKPYVDEAVASKSASVTIAGGSFPVNLIGFKQGTFDIDRVEWKVWSSSARRALTQASCIRITASHIRRLPPRWTRHRRTPRWPSAMQLTAIGVSSRLAALRRANRTSTWPYANCYLAMLSTQIQPIAMATSATPTQPTLSWEMEIQAAGGVMRPIII